MRPLPQTSKYLLYLIYTHIPPLTVRLQGQKRPTKKKLQPISKQKWLAFIFLTTGRFSIVCGWIKVWTPWLVVTPAPIKNTPTPLINE
jgi:hypothetical protein